MRQNDDLRDKLVTYLEDAHAFEHQIVQVLESQVKDTEKFPEIQARIRQHLDETRVHEQRMADCLAAYNEKPSAMKAAGSSVMGNMIGAVSGARTDALSKAARDDYMTEHMEIASYMLLIATAQLCGDQKTIQAAQANLRDEIAMAQWLEQNLPMTVVYSFQQDGIDIDQSQIPQVMQVAQQSLQLSGGGASGMSGMNTGMGSMSTGATLGSDALGATGSDLSGSTLGTGMGGGVNDYPSGSGYTGETDASTRTSTGAGMQGNMNTSSRGILGSANDPNQPGVVDPTDNPSRSGLVGDSQRNVQSESSLNASGAEAPDYDYLDNLANENTNPNI